MCCGCLVVSEVTTSEISSATSNFRCIILFLTLGSTRSTRQRWWRWSTRSSRTPWSSRSWRSKASKLSITRTHKLCFVTKMKFISSEKHCYWIEEWKKHSLASRKKLMVPVSMKLSLGCIYSIENLDSVFNRDLGRRANPPCYLALNLHSDNVYGIGIN